MATAMHTEPRGYPVMLNLAGRCCVVVGGGRVAERKVEGLLEAGAQIIVISPALTARLAQRAAHGEITVHCEPYATGLIADYQPVLVFAATNDPAVNRQVVEESHHLGALVDAVDADNERDFSSMATLRRGPITLGISTDGASPALTKHLRTRLDALIGMEYDILATWLSAARPQVIAGVSNAPTRHDLWQSILTSPILDLLRDGDESAARATFDALLEKSLI